MILVMYSNFSPSERHRTALSCLGRGQKVFAAHNEAEAVAHAPEAEIILGHRFLRQALPYAGKLRWVQTTAAGIDMLRAPQLLQKHITLSRNPIHSPVVARHAIAMAWSLIRRIPQAALFQNRKIWATSSTLFPLPLPQTALVMGLGEIGREICRLLRAQDIKVIGTARSGSDEQRAACDEYISFDYWPSALGSADICFIALPLTRTTRGIMGTSEIAKFKPHAIIVNIARDPIIDISAVAEALREGRLGGAATDVLDPIPAADSPLWHSPNLLITPKMASYYPEMQEETEKFIEGQIARYMQGEPPLYIVDKDTLLENLFQEDAS